MLEATCVVPILVWEGPQVLFNSRLVPWALGGATQ